MTERMLYALEILNLLCEWEDCSVSVSEIETLISHIIEEHLGRLKEDDLHCHWKDCEGFTETLAELRRHILLHAFHTKIKCHGQNFQNQKKLPDCSLSIHSRNIIPELPEPLICAWSNCWEEIECPEYFYRHVDCHADSATKSGIPSTVTCLWQDCNRKFADQYKLKDHLRSHTQEKLVACPTCGGMFASRTRFADHIERQMPVDESDPENTFICEYCLRKMSSERLLRDHMRHHVNHYKCTHCDMTCPTPSALHLHIAYRHSDDKPHACEYCEYRCKSENDLRKHLETHSQFPSYKCPVEGCSYATRYHTCLNSHYRRKHEGKEPSKYSCHICDKICTRGNYLTKHLINCHKFKWPSGHCRFRYRLHEDGLYRLQTVRYESLGLSETLTPESAENADDASSLMNDDCEVNVDDPDSCCKDQPQITGDNIASAEPSTIFVTHTDSSAIPITNIDSSAIPVTNIDSSAISGTNVNLSTSSGSVLMCVEDNSPVRFRQIVPVADASATLTYTEDPIQQPVLINIADAKDSNPVQFQQIAPAASVTLTYTDDHIGESVLINMVDTEDRNPVADASVSLAYTEEPSQEPVLINIVDAEDQTSESGGSILLIKTAHPIANDQTRAIQLITEDSNGQILVETAEIITRYGE